MASQSPDSQQLRFQQNSEGTFDDMLRELPTIRLLNELKRRYMDIAYPEKRVVFVGAPGCGKGTQSDVVKTEFGICHISTGDLLREAIASGSPMGGQVKEKVDKGEFVNDELVLGLLREKMETPNCRRGFILDGYPRNLNQAEALNNLLRTMKTGLNAVFYFDAPEDIILKRVCGRWSHPGSGRVYHSDFKPPKVPGFDDVTGEPLVQRQDDNPTALKKRLEVFHRETMPLIDYYSRLGLLHRVDASRAAPDVTEAIMSVLKKGDEEPSDANLMEAMGAVLGRDLARGS